MNPTTPTAQLALDTILRKPTKGIPAFFSHVMQHEFIDRIAGVPAGTYAQNPEETYIAMERNLGICMLDQYIWRNPMTMGNLGYEGGEHGATTGAHEVVVDGMVIDSPEAVVEHLEKFTFPWLEERAKDFDEDAHKREVIEREHSIQERLGPEILKTGYESISFPCLAYTRYGYVNYFSAYALYPEVMEKHFSLQADVCVRNNRATAKAYAEANLPPLNRLDHDMADSRGTLVSIDSLDRIWLPHFARALEPMLGTGVKMLWHCDGNLMQMVPRLIECGVKGFQGFQYEDGMDYEKICRMNDRDGEPLMIIGGVSVTTTLPLGRPADVKRQMEWLVENGPKTGLFLSASSSIIPQTPWENIQTFWDGLVYYREHGR